MSTEQTYIMVKVSRRIQPIIVLENQTTDTCLFEQQPDGVQRGLVGEIIARFEKRGYKLVGLKMATPGKEHLEKHYADLATKPFFPGLITYMTSGPVVGMVWEGRDAVK